MVAGVVRVGWVAGRCLTSTAIVVHLCHCCIQLLVRELRAT
jgi:hypothetical protein